MQSQAEMIFCQNNYSKIVYKVTVHEPDLHAETHLNPVQVLSTTIESFSPRMVPW